MRTGTDIHPHACTITALAIVISLTGGCSGSSPSPGTGGASEPLSAATSTQGDVNCGFATSTDSTPAPCPTVQTGNPPLQATTTGTGAATTASPSAATGRIGRALVIGDSTVTVGFARSGKAANTQCPADATNVVGTKTKQTAIDHINTEPTPVPGGVTSASDGQDVSEELPQDPCGLSVSGTLVSVGLTLTNHRPTRAITSAIPALLASSDDHRYIPIAGDIMGQGVPADATVTGTLWFDVAQQDLTGLAVRVHGLWASQEIVIPTGL